MAHVPSGLRALRVLLAALFGARGRATPPPATPPFSHLLSELTVLSQKITAHALRLKINEVVTQARSLLNYLQTQPNSAAPWRDYVHDCITSAVTRTRRFADLSPHLTDPTDTAVVQFGSFLASITQILASVSRDLSGDPAAGFTADIQAYRDTLNGVNQAGPAAGKPF